MRRWNMPGIAFNERSSHLDEYRLLGNQSIIVRNSQRDPVCPGRGIRVLRHDALGGGPVPEVPLV